MLEVLVALRGDKDDPIAWASFAHQQRYTAAHFADPLLLPGVIHLAKKADDYLPPTYEREPRPCRRPAMDPLRAVEKNQRQRPVLRS